MNSFKRSINHQVGNKYKLIIYIEIETDLTTGRDYLKCEYNRDGDAYRSPWSNKYFPQATDDPIYPNAELL